MLPKEWFGPTNVDVVLLPLVPTCDNFRTSVKCLDNDWVARHFESISCLFPSIERFEPKTLQF